MKNKIALITHEFPPMHGGVGVSSDRISRVLGDRYDVTVYHVLPFHYKEKIPSDFKSDLNVERVYFGERSYLKDSNEITVNELSLKGTREQQEIYIELKKKIEADKPELLITLYVTNFGHIASLISKQLSIPHLTSIRGNDIGKNFFMPEMLPHLTYALKASDYIVSVNRELLQVAHSMTPVRDKSRVIHNSVNQELAKDLKDVHVEGLDPSRLTIVSIGIFRFKKGLNYLLEALEGIDRDIQLLLIGDFKSDEEKQIHQPLLDKLKKKTKVCITGMVDQGLRFSYLNLGDIAVIPSLFSEGCPSTLLESMALKKAIVTTNAGACGEIIHHNSNGLIAKQADSESLREQILTLIDDEQLRHSLAQKAYDDSLLMNSEREANEWGEVIDKLIR